MREGASRLAVRASLLGLAMLAAGASIARSQDTEPVDDQAAQQMDAIREGVGEAAETVGEGLRDLFGFARERAGAAARDVGERVRAAVTGEPRRREPAQDQVVGMMRIAPAQVAVNAAQIDQMANQLRPYLRSELYLVREVCSPTEEQDRELRDAGEEALRNVAEPFAGNGVIIRSDQPEPGPAERLQEELAGAIDEILSDEQRAAYRAEFDARAEDRKQTTIRNLVAYIDERVLLTDAQRDALGRSLAENWDEGWYAALELFQYGDQYFPRLPDQCVLPVLDETQTRIWRARMQNNSVIHIGGLTTQPVANDPLDEPESGAGETSLAPGDENH